MGRLELQVTRALARVFLASPSVGESLEARIAAALDEVVTNNLTFPEVAGSGDIEALVAFLNNGQPAQDHGRVSRAELAVLRDALALYAWDCDAVWFGEVSVDPLHHCECEWGALPDVSLQKLHLVELAIEALDFAAMLLGPDDTLAWRIQST